MTEHPASVFVIDDDAGFLRAVGRLLRLRGFDVSASRGIAEFAALLPLPPGACVLADIVMPGGSGFELPAMLGAAAPPIVWITASDDPDTLARARALGDAECLRKPVEEDDLVAAIRAALARAKDAAAECCR